MPTMNRPSRMRKKFETSPHSRQPTPHRPDMRVMAFFLDVLSAMKESGNTNRVIPQSTAEPATPIWESVNPRAFCMAGNTEVTPARREVKQEQHVQDDKGEHETGAADRNGRFFHGSPNRGRLGGLGHGRILLFMRERSPRLKEDGAGG